LSRNLIAIEPGFLPQYDELPKDIRKKFKKQISLLEENPNHPSLKIHRLEGSEFREFYVDDFYRCVFKQEGNIYKLYFIGTHRLIDRFK
jgi:mRNA-degrading endonuclease RelE of RelBE toxin-antitoxin system